ncbi:hypothetical protein O181_087938 [Austropuccinia psidii MF-1]|uniref:Uncharacterized protein n=1 Tax=Austropuccinia psidii MF-1 TaxID=1389203 RepID=A0A9Q3P1Z1_9BASI|nr:hypothetical protein [Austropuccinia psidii MF-1]
MSPKKKSINSNRSWVRCPRHPCIVSYHPRSAHQHLSSCRYFRCLNESCEFVGTQSQVNNHQSSCPFGLRSEEIGTTDPLSDSESQVFDILTSPHLNQSYPTEPSSDFSPLSSSQKSFNPNHSKFKPDRLNSNQFNSTSKFCNKNHSIKSINSLNITSNHQIHLNHSILNPYDPSSNKIFSLPFKSVNSTLQTAPSKKPINSSPVPSSPNRRLSTYELQRYKPIPSSTNQSTSSFFLTSSLNSSQSSDLQTQLIHKTAQLNALKRCYTSVLNQFDDFVYSVYCKASDASLLQELNLLPLEAYREVLTQLVDDQIPELILNSGHFLEENNHLQNFNDHQENSKQNPKPISTVSNEGSELSNDQLADQVRQKISQSKHQPYNLMDSPGNVFSRKRKFKDQSDCKISDSTCSVSSDKPTQFVQKLADTTWDPSDEIDNSLPSRCNFTRLIEQAHKKMKSRVKKRNGILSS